MKRWGQNFVIDANTVRRIVRTSGVDETDDVVEVGPGLGSLTLALLEAARSVAAVEIDENLAAALPQTVEQRAPGLVDRLSVHAADALELTAFDRAPTAFVANLPYNVAVPVVVRLLEETEAVERIVVLVQREVGERLAATPGDAQYGAVSVKVAYYSEASVLGVVPPTVFVPRPRVESVVVGLVRRPVPPVDVPSVDDLFALVRSGFGQRRKMLRRSLLPLLGARTVAVLEGAGIAPTARAETLGLEEWAAVARGAAVAA
jgi:16S rRNA (adenine1518-N6/adenine1519-N6)-dimethyltransferase